jgi:hypothetical protein
MSHSDSKGEGFMKKRWIPFILMCLAVAFLAGQLLGAQSQAEHQGALMASQNAMQTTIAVINADVGMYVDGERQNFSAAIIDTLGEDFVLVSPAMAHSGYTSGLYAAIITFPSNVSQRVLSFNSYNPQQVRLEFQVNPHLPESAFIETYTRIMDLQMAINTTIAYTYVISLFGGLHAAQDHAGSIFQNNDANMTALDIVNMQRFTPSLQLDSLPALPLDPNAPVTTHFLLGVTDFAEIVSTLYLGSFQTAANDYMDMREVLIAMTDYFPEQENMWMEALEDWSDIFARHGEDIQAYSTVVRSHQQDLLDWHSRADTWNEGLAGHQEELEEWHNEIYTWSDYLAEHRQNALDWTLSAYGWSEVFTVEQQELLGWHTAASYWNEQLSSHESEMLEWTSAAAAWHGGLLESQESIFEWHGALYDWSGEAVDWHSEIEGHLGDVEWFVAGLLADVESHRNDIESHRNDVERHRNDVYMSARSWFDNDVAEAVRVHNDDIRNINAVIDSLTEWQSGAVGEISRLQHMSANARSMATNININNPYDHGGDSASPESFSTSTLNGLSDLFSLLAEIEGMLSNLDNNMPAFPDGAPRLEPLTLAEWDFTLDESDPMPPPMDKKRFEAPDIELPSPYQAPPPSPAEVIRPEEIEPPAALNADQPGNMPEFQPEEPETPPAAAMDRPDAVGSHDLTPPGHITILDAHQPYNPQVGAPPRPDDFWASLGYMHDQLLSFDVDDYLTPAYRAEVQRMLRAYELYLQEIRADLAGQFNYNVHMLTDVRHGYTSFLSNLRTEAMQAEINAIDELLGTIAAFSEIVEDTSANTHQRLQAFASMLPESRHHTGPNHELAVFTVAPFDFVSPQLRTANDTAHAEANAVTGMFEQHLWIAVPALGIVFLATLGSYGIAKIRKDRVERN